MNKRIDKKRQKMAAQSAAQTCNTVSFYIQYQNEEYLTSEITDKVLAQCKADGASETDLENLSIYLKPEDHKAYYAYHGKNGSIDL